MVEYGKTFYREALHFSFTVSVVLMIFEEGYDSIRKQNGDGDFLYPCYEESCLSNIPGTILDLFGVKTERPTLPLDFGKGLGDAKKVVLFVLDGFGYNQFLRYYRDHKFLAKLAEQGEVFPLTSVFPSQTTNALTTLNTGLTPQEHGLFECFIYLKEVGLIVNTLRFELLESKRRNDLLEQGFNPNILFKGKAILRTLNEAGVKTFAHLHISDAYCAISKLLFQGSTIVPSLKSSDLIVKLRKKLEKEEGPAYFFVHLSNLDTIAHEYGPHSEEYCAELSMITYLLNKELVEKLDRKKAKETLFLVTADHGGVNIAPEETTYLNWFPEVVQNLQTGKGGKRIFPTGSPRDVFLHVKEDKLVETGELLSQKIGDKAKIIETKEAIKNGLFGLGEVTSEFFERVGNLLIIPHGNETVWFEHFKGRKLTLHGHHGGLCEEEMLVPLAITKLADLK